MRHALLSTSSKTLPGLISTYLYLQSEDVISGRQEIYECWAQGFADPDNVDESAVLDSVWGALQLAFNNLENPLMTAYVISLGSLPHTVQSPESFIYLFSSHPT